MDASPTSPHPNDQMLHSYGSGTLDVASADAVRGHVEGCPDCRRKVAGEAPEAADGPAARPAAGGFEQTVQADVRHRALLRGSERAERFEVGDGGVIGRDAEVARFHL